MNIRRLLIMVAALVAALSAAYLAMGLLQKPQPQPQLAPKVVQKSDTVDVLITGRNIPPGEKLGSTGLQWRAWPRDGVSAEMFARDAMPDALEQMRAARAKVALVAGDPILTSHIIRPGEAGFMSAMLPGGMVAAAIPITELSSVSGFILPNDRVNVIFTRTLANRLGNKNAASEAVLTNVKVLAINQTLASGTDEATVPEGRTAVLELEPLQAEVLGKLIMAGQISLALRSLSDVGDGKPHLAEAYRTPARAKVGALVVRYGLERQLSGR
jgi:pilus assembly protein CpaB